MGNATAFSPSTSVSLVITFQSTFLYMLIYRPLTPCTPSN